MQVLLGDEPPLLPDAALKAPNIVIKPMLHQLVRQHAPWWSCFEGLSTPDLVSSLQVQWLHMHSVVCANQCYALSKLRMCICCAGSRSMLLLSHLRLPFDCTGKFAGIEQEAAFDQRWDEHCLELSIKRLQLKDERKRQQRQRNSLPNWVLGNGLSGRQEASRRHSLLLRNMPCMCT